MSPGLGYYLGVYRVYMVISWTCSHPFPIVLVLEATMRGGIFSLGHHAELQLRFHTYFGIFVITNLHSLRLELKRNGQLSENYNNRLNENYLAFLISTGVSVHVST